MRNESILIGYGKIWLFCFNQVSITEPILWHCLSDYPVFLPMFFRTIFWKFLDFVKSKGKCYQFQSMTFDWFDEINTKERNINHYSYVNLCWFCLCYQPQRSAITINLVINRVRDLSIRQEHFVRIIYRWCKGTYCDILHTSGPARRFHWPHGNRNQTTVHCLSGKAAEFLAAKLH